MTITTTIIEDRHNTQYQPINVVRAFLFMYEVMRVEPARYLHALFGELYAELPLAVLVQDTVLVVHGGLGRDPEQQLTHLKALSDIVLGAVWVLFEGFSMICRRFSMFLVGFQAIFNGFRRFSSRCPSFRSVAWLLLAQEATREPTVNPWGMEGDKCMDALVDTLWADPSNVVGSKENPRGCSHLWGPDYTRRFLKATGLQLVIRSHQVPEDQRLGGVWGAKMGQNRLESARFQGF